MSVFMLLILTILLGKQGATGPGDEPLMDTET